MKETEQEYFLINLSHLDDELIFPFHIFIHNPGNNSYTPFLYANSPLTSEAKELIKYIEEKGGSLAVSMSQKKTFLYNQSLEEKDVPSLCPKELHDLEKKRLENMKELGIDSEDGAIGFEKKLDGLPPFAFKDEVGKSIDGDNYSAIINRVRQEAMIFSPRISPTVSLASYLCEKLMHEDNFTNRVVAISYMLAKTTDIQDEEALGELICAAYLVHIGMTQLDEYLCRKPQVELSDDEKKQFKRHPGLSHHLIRKSGIEISDRCKLAIFEHHERWDGSGFPNAKQGNYIEPIGLIIGAVAHIFEFSEGMVNGDKQPIKSVISAIKNKTPTAGLQLDFGDRINETLIHLIESSNNEEAA